MTYQNTMWAPTGMTGVHTIPLWVSIIYADALAPNKCQCISNHHTYPNLTDIQGVMLCNVCNFQLTINHIMAKCHMLGYQCRHVDTAL